MPIQFVSGDLFANRFDVQAFAHGCNCQSVMGKGIALQCKQRYPAMNKEYRSRCKAVPREFDPGDVFFWKSDELPHVFNLATQEDYWRGKVKARLDWVEQSMIVMRDIAEQESIISIAMPQIGAGLGSLDWNAVKEIIHLVFRDWAGNLYVYEEFIPEA